MKIFSFIVRVLERNDSSVFIVIKNGMGLEAESAREGGCGDFAASTEDGDP